MIKKILKIRAKALSKITNIKLFLVPSSDLIFTNFVASKASEELEIKLIEKPAIILRKNSMNEIFEKLLTTKYHLTVIKKGIGKKTRKIMNIFLNSICLIVFKNSSWFIKFINK